MFNELLISLLYIKVKAQSNTKVNDFSDDKHLLEEVIMYGNSVKLVFDLDELRYYFDAEQRDSIDRGSISRKSGEVLLCAKRWCFFPIKSLISL